MARQARGEFLDPNSVQIFHTIQRCVRRAFLCGKDIATGKSFEHRRGWIQERLEALASVFGIDCLTYAVMNNHVHLILRSRPDIVRTWSDEEVARRWLCLFPKRPNSLNQLEDVTHAASLEIVNSPARLAELRTRLSDISWWMRCMSENIARRANREDECTGRFWEGRYRSQELLDEASILACAMYVDLNPVRAAMADSLDKAAYTGANQRLTDLKSTHSISHFNSSILDGADTLLWERSRDCRCSGWLSPIEISKLGPDADGTGRRASQKGFLSIPLGRYLQLLEWTGRQIGLKKESLIPGKLKPILVRLGISSPNWLRLVKRFGRVFKRVAGGPVALAHASDRRGQRWLQAPGAVWLSG